MRNLVLIILLAIALAVATRAGLSHVEAIGNHSGFFAFFVGAAIVIVYVVLWARKMDR